MIGLDTNVLVRVLVDDGSADVTKARKFVAAQAAEGCDFFVDTVVLVEMVWVLETVFGYGRTDIGTAIDAILGYAVTGGHRRAGMHQGQYPNRAAVDLVHQPIAFMRYHLA